jgi:hypothetical protein
MHLAIIRVANKEKNMRTTALTCIALAALAIAGTASAQAHRQPDANPFWNGCVIARQVDPNGTNIAIGRVCSKINADFSIFEPYQMGQRPQLAGSLGPTSINNATLRFTGFNSSYVLGDGRLARLHISESGPAQTHAEYTYDLTLRTDQEAIVYLASGIMLGLRMDSSGVPTSFDTSLTMPTWHR